MTWPLFIQALTNLVAVEKVTKIKKLATVGNATAKSGGKKGFPNASSLPELVRKMGCLCCLKGHAVADCPVPKSVVCTHGSKMGIRSQPAFLKSDLSSQLGTVRCKWQPNRSLHFQCPQVRRWWRQVVGLVALQRQNPHRLPLPLYLK